MGDLGFWKVGWIGLVCRKGECWIEVLLDRRLWEAACSAIETYPLDTAVLNNQIRHSCIALRHISHYVSVLGVSLLIRYILCT